MDTINHCWQLAGASLLFGLLSGCSGPLSVESKWGEGVPRGQSFDNYLIVGVTTEYNVRCRFERLLAARMRENNVTATTSCSFMNPEDPLTVEGITPAIKEIGADAVLVTELLGRQAELVEGGTSESRGEAYYKPVGYGYTYRYPYYGGYGMPVATTYVDFRVEQSVFEVEESVAIATSLFETSEAVMVFAVKTTAYKRRTREEILDLITQGITDRLRRDGLAKGSD